MERLTVLGSKNRPLFHYHLTIFLHKNQDGSKAVLVFLTKIERNASKKVSVYLHRKKTTNVIPSTHHFVVIKWLSSMNSRIHDDSTRAESKCGNSQLVLCYVWKKGWLQVRKGLTSELFANAIFLSWVIRLWIHQLWRLNLSRLYSETKLYIKSFKTHTGNSSFLVKIALTVNT